MRFAHCSNSRFIYKMINETTTEIAPNLYLGNINVLSNAGHERLITLSIQRLLFVAKIASPPNPDQKFQALKLAFIDAVDSEEQNLLSHFDTTYKFISEGIKQGQSVVVACEAGISRSCTIVAAYLMKEYDIDAYDALAMIKKHRPLAHPNPGFFEQLQLYERLGCFLGNMDNEMRLKMAKYPLKATYQEQTSKANI